MRPPDGAPAKRRAARRRSGGAPATPGEAAKKASAGTEFLVVTGLSGSGRSSAVKALEDQGAYCVDNLPTALLP